MLRRMSTAARAQPNPILAACQRAPVGEPFPPEVQAEIERAMEDIAAGRAIVVPLAGGAAFCKRLAMRMEESERLRELGVPVVTSADVAAARAKIGPQAEPDRSVWRILSCAGGVAVSDAQIASVVPGATVEEIAAARARVADQVVADEGIPGSMDELLGGPSITISEGVGCGIMEPEFAEAIGVETACASST